MDPASAESPDRARRQMHGIFVGEIQALEGAGRTAYDYDTTETPFAMKLDMARQCWDEARHVEISLLLGEHMGTDVGEYSEAITLFEASCHADPVFRLAGVNRALEGLAIDVFTTMRDFASEMDDPVLWFAEDWMLADEVTHVKMGSTWLRELTKNDADRQKRALEFQRTVDGLFNFRGMRGEITRGSDPPRPHVPRDGRVRHRRDRRDRSDGRSRPRRRPRLRLLTQSAVRPAASRSRASSRHRRRDEGGPASTRPRTHAPGGGALAHVTGSCHPTCAPAGTDTRHEPRRGKQRRIDGHPSGRCSTCGSRRRASSCATSTTNWRVSSRCSQGAASTLRVHAVRDRVDGRATAGCWSTPCSSTGAAGPSYTPTRGTSRSPCSSTASVSG